MLAAAGLHIAVDDLVVETSPEHTEGVVLGVSPVQEQWELGKDHQGYKAEETLDLAPVQLEKHTMAVGNPRSSVEDAAPFETLQYRSCMSCNLCEGFACTPLWEDVKGTEMAADHQTPGKPVVQPDCKLQVRSGSCKAVCWQQSLEYNLRMNKDWTLPPGTAPQNMDAAVVESVSGTAAFAVVVVVQWLLVARLVIAVGKPDTRPSVVA